MTLESHTQKSNSPAYVCLDSQPMLLKRLQSDFSELTTEVYVSCNHSRGPCCVSTGFVGLVAYHLLRQALNQPDSIREMEIILKSCVGNGSFHPLRSNHVVESKARSGQAKVSRLTFIKYQGILSLSEDVPYTSPNPCILDWKQEPTVHFHQTSTSLTNLHHCSSHRCRSSYSLIPTGRVNRLPIRLSVRVDR